MNVQPVSFMPVNQPAGELKKGMNVLENRVETNSFSKELDRKIDESKIEKESKPQNVSNGQSRISNQGKKSAQSELDKDSSEEKIIANDSEETVNAKVKVKSESGEVKLDKKQTKQERLKKFMDSLESEFQIPPTRIVEAFSQLTPQELSLPAEQSISQVVENLDLQGESAEKVKILYGDLVEDLGSIDSKKAGMIGTTIGGSDMVDGKLASAAALGLTQQRFDKVKTQRTALQKSLDQMNQNFWQPQGALQTPVVATPDALSKPQLSHRDLSGLESYRDISAADTSLLQPDDMGLPSDREFLYDPTTGELFSTGMGSQSDTLEKAAVAPANQNIDGNNQKDSSAKGAALLAGIYEKQSVPMPESLAKNPSLSPNLSEKLATLSAQSGEAVTDGGQHILSKTDLSNSGGQGPSDFFSKGQKDPESRRTVGSTKKASGDELKAMLATTVAAGEIKDSKEASAVIAAPLPEITPDIADRNVQNVFQQAQYLVKNGGGEMKVRMTPEGLGEIQLSVELKDGRVQLQMVTDNKETKRMLESNLSDLRESLIQQKINLDSVKIDSVVRTNVENQAQGGNQFGQNSRDTRQFWNQFQEQFGGRPQREALFEQPKVKGYAPKKSLTIGPAESSVSGQSNGKAKGLNLVA